MNRRLAGVTIAVASLLLLAGCAGLGPPRSDTTATPAPTGADVQVQLSNGGNATHLFTVAVVPDGRFGGVRVEYANGTNRTFPDAESFDDLPRRATDGAVSLVPLGENVTVRRYRLTPGSGVGTSFESVPRNATVVTVISSPARAEPLRSFGASACADVDVTRIDLRVTANGIVEKHTTCADTAVTG